LAQNISVGLRSLQISSVAIFLVACFVCQTFAARGRDIELRSVALERGERAIRNELRQENFPLSDRQALIDLRNEPTNTALRESDLNGWSNDFPDEVTCQWAGVTCSADGIITLQLAGLGIKKLPDSIFQLKRCTIFDFRDNEIVGTLPAAITLGDARPTFSAFYLSNNQFTGPIPNSLMKSNLKNFNISRNHFDGTLPSNIGNMAELWVLDVSHNNLSGQLPASFVQLGQMDTLYLNSNQFSGSLLPGLSQMSQLSRIDLSDNDFTGSFPDLIALPTLNYLNITGNLFDGLAPSFLRAYSQGGDISGVTFRCLLFFCFDGIECVLADAFCTCPCSATNGGDCVLNSLECACLPHRWGPNCENFCPGNSDSFVVACSGRGTCVSATGVCSCDTGYGGSQCQTECPGGVANPCSGFGTCNADATCTCQYNRGGDNCFDCAYGFAGPNCNIECLGGVADPCSSSKGQGFCNGGLIGDGRCVCNAGYEGVMCEREANDLGVDEAWLIVGIILIILFVVAVVLIVVGSYYGWRQYNDYQELKSKEVPMDEMRGRGSDSDESKDDSKVGTKRKEDIEDI